MPNLESLKLSVAKTEATGLQLAALLANNLALRYILPLTTWPSGILPLTT